MKVKVAVLMVCLMSVGSALGAVIYSDDFNDGNGQLLSSRGWTISGADAFAITDTTGFGSANPAIKGDSIGSGVGRGYYLPLSDPSPGSLAYTLDFKAYATASGTAICGMYFTTDTDDVIYLESNSGRWDFRQNLLGTETTSSFSPGFAQDCVADCSIVMDFANSKTWATISDGTQTVTTPEIAVSSVDLKNFMALKIWADTRAKSYGMDIDDIKVTETVPEPVSLVLLGLGVLGLRKRT